MILRSAFRLVPLLAAGLLAFFTWSARADDNPKDSPRFTDSLTVAQRGEIGLERLSSDNVAVINALVRQDETAARRRNTTVTSTTFSARRTPHEREICGFDRLTPAEIKRLDDCITPRIADAVPRPISDFVFVPSIPASLTLTPSSVERVDRRPPLDIHGSFSLTYGWSKEGSIRGGDAVVTVHDPVHNFTLSVGYSEYRGKGYAPWLSPTDVYYNRPGYDPLFDR